MDEVTPLKPNRLGMGIADALRGLRDLMGPKKGATNWMGADGSPRTTTQDSPIGDLLLGKAPEEMENIAYGDLPMRMPEMSNIPVMKTGRKQGVADLAMVGLDALPVANAVHKSLGRAAEKGLEAAAKRVPEGVKSAAREIQGAVTGGSPVANVIRPTGDNWAPGQVEFLTDVLRRSRPKLDDPKQDAALDKWVTSNMGNYFKKQWGTPDDPVRSTYGAKADNKYAANRQQLKYGEYDEYINPQYQEPEKKFMNALDSAEASRVDGRELAMRQPPASAEGEFYPRAFDERIEHGESPTGAGVFDTNTDAAIQPSSMETYRETLKDWGEDIPEWMAKADPNKPVYSLKAQMEPNGGASIERTLKDNKFPRMIELIADELRAGSMRPEQLNKVSVGDAAKRVLAEAEREPQELSKKATENLPAYRGMEYPDGSKWVEVPGTGRHLRVEGDLMGHCVGGYCEMVVNGEKRILSLRDAQGLPHVTIDSDGRVFGDRGQRETNLGTIRQIFGKGNSVARPYSDKIQDFLRTGKPRAIDLWGEVQNFDQPDFVDNPRVWNKDIDSAYGIGKVDNIVEKFDPYDEAGLSDRLRPLALDKQKGHATLSDMEEVVNRLRLSPVQGASDPNDALLAYDNLRALGLDPGSLGKFRKILDSQPDPRKFSRELSALAGGQKPTDQAALDVWDNRLARVNAILRGEVVEIPPEPRPTYKPRVEDEWEPANPELRNPGGWEANNMTPMLEEFEDYTNYRINPDALGDNLRYDRLIQMVNQMNTMLTNDILDDDVMQGILDNMVRDGLIVAP